MAFAAAPLKDLWRWSYPLIKNEKLKIKNSEGEIIERGLICLKGGDLSQEISESGVRPKMVEINSLFEEVYFREKYLLYVAK